LEVLIIGLVVVFVLWIIDKTNSPAKSVIIDTLQAAEKIVESAENTAKSINASTARARESNAAWVDKKLSEFTDEQRKNIARIDPSIKLPPKNNRPVNTTAKSAAWMSPSLSEYTDEERAFIKSLDPTIVLPDPNSGRLTKTATGNVCSTQDINEITADDRETIAKCNDEVRSVEHDIGTEYTESYVRNIDNEKAIRYGRTSISALARRKGVKKLLHFTRYENLKCILTEGLIRRDELENSGRVSIFNDSLRLDNHTDSISISLTHPNAPLFCKLQRQHADANWVVLEIAPSVMWGFKCAFFKNNAADRRMRSLDIVDQMGVRAFESMFEDSDSLSLCRTRNALPENQPTDPQAEVLLLEDLPTNRIIGVHCVDADILAEIGNTHPYINAMLTPAFFTHRDSGQNKWQHARSLPQFAVPMSSRSKRPI